MADTERKEYSIVGKVTIGTDEYRDLIEAVATNEAKAKASDDKYWDKWRECDKLQTELKKLQNKYDQYGEFIKSNNLMDKFRLFLVEKQSEEDDEDN